MWLDTDSLVLGVDFRNNNIHFPGPSESQDVGLLRVVCSIWPASFSLPTVLLLSLIPPDTHITYSPQLLPDPSCLRKKMFPFRIHPIVEDAELGAQDIRSDFAHKIVPIPRQVCRVQGDEVIRGFAPFSLAPRQKEVLWM